MKIFFVVLLVLVVCAGIAFAQEKAVGFRWKIKGQLNDASGIKRDCPVVNIPARGVITHVDGNVSEFFLNSDKMSTIQVTTSRAVGMILEPANYSVVPVPGTVNGTGWKYGGITLYIAYKP